jgi:rhodanese-related sulfurtransferase
VAVAFGVWAFWAPRLSGLDPTNPAITLSDIERTVTARYPLPELTPAGLSAALKAPGTVVFDVRERDEYATSAIPGAIRIDPGTTAEAFMAQHGAQVAGKQVVFYCAVGVRSGIMAQRTNRQLSAAGASGVYNLRGGIFRWHAEGGDLVAAAGGPASGVHPYDQNWGQLLTRTLQSRPGAPQRFQSTPGGPRS